MPPLSDNLRLSALLCPKSNNLVQPIAPLHPTITMFWECLNIQFENSGDPLRRLSEDWVTAVLFDIISSKTRSKINLRRGYNIISGLPARSCTGLEQTVANDLSSVASGKNEFDDGNWRGIQGFENVLWNLLQNDDIPLWLLQTVLLIFWICGIRHFIEVRRQIAIKIPYRRCRAVVDSVCARWGRRCRAHTRTLGTSHSAAVMGEFRSKQC